MPVYTVAQVARYMRETLERDSLLSDLWVNGEASNVFRSGAGHCYFTLKDRESQLRCVMFRSVAPARLPQDGEAVVAHGRVSLYEARGDVQLYVDMVQPEGLGLQQLELERLKAKLQAEGLFDEARKRPLPRFPRSIGVVTSPQGAVLHDIISVIGRRYPAVELVIAPTRVQGDGAAEEIVAALTALTALSDIDVVIVARGGGSAEDLSAFNAEVVARAVYGSRAPVVSAVGHETDVTLVDFVADRRAPTPSAAAEMVVPDRLELRAAITSDEKRLVAAMADAIAQRRREVHAMTGRMAARVPDVAQRRQRVDDLLRSATAHIRTTLALRRERVRGLALQIASLSPARTLSRGYAVVERDGTTVVSVAQVRPGDPITVHVSDGRFGGVVR